MFVLVAGGVANCVIPCGVVARFVGPREAGLTAVVLDVLVLLAEGSRERSTEEVVVDVGRANAARYRRNDALKNDEGRAGVTRQ
ncbi:MAG: hypothetical protein KC668_29020, partial [Myxococcales bacterium]|nr:hypothetical protein [Myxococcales bacterium]